MWQTLPLAAGPVDGASISTVNPLQAAWGVANTMHEVEGMHRCCGRAAQDCVPMHREDAKEGQGRLNPIHIQDSANT
jgi:hypothetical protein